jgi:hypothetical protein
VTVDNIVNFVYDYEDGIIPIYIRGADKSPKLDHFDFVPGSNVVITTNSFPVIANDPDKDIFIKFYSPYCPHSI